MGLSEEEQALLKKLQRKAEAPDAPPVGKNLNVSIDLGDEKQVKRAVRLGLLDDSDFDAGGEEEEEAEEKPKRKGYFNE